ncbi:two-component system sensor histidine kinase NtrB [Terriglobus saanensis]|uniref:histidine kinase n=1 Tax=Terriglobus saanensis (strain ATCC BAA-1853 / DSM 23119 / SP1PR4) TaxID=401053 RepID=E8V484_TERSS|nr:ATP-binding protein [Terriglobus saanensis]ADV83633.1 PAS/PAC sensor signal transduction histidine kinase [Terriglobus saanensis SP1PR4]
MKIEETLQLAAETAGVGTWHLTLPENELRSSPRCREIFGLSADAAFRYEDFLSAVHPDDRALVEAMVEHALDPKGTGLYELDYRVLYPDGTVRWVGGKGKAFFEEQNGQRVATRFIGTVLDRTERRKIQDALIEAEKLAVTGRLAASIAHEIRNPVDAVMSLLYLIRSESSETKRSEYIEQAEGELSRVAEIATNTLRFYQDPAGLTTFDLADLADTVLNLFRGRISTSRVKVQAELPRGVFVSAPQGELRQVVANLVGNALDAMPTGGRLILRIRKFVNSRTGKQCVRLTVADTGIGMSPEVLARVFEAFYTTKGAAGNGLGLWLSLEILKRCGSSMQVRSAVGRGTVFELSLEGAEPKIRS